jgi:hypothetical protein
VDGVPDNASDSPFLKDLTSSTLVLASGLNCAPRLASHSRNDGLSLPPPPSQPASSDSAAAVHAIAAMRRIAPFPAPADSIFMLVSSAPWVVVQPSTWSHVGLAFSAF